MIEKLSTYKITSRDAGAFINVDCNTKVINTLVLKINELVDIVNSVAKVQEKLIDGRFVVETIHEEPTDPYAEQRKWIGKLCKFWDGVNKKYVVYGIFDKINENHSQYVYVAKNGVHYEFCEPVNPDDNVIYKGE